jgi:hypothetical protein
MSFTPFSTNGKANGHTANGHSEEEAAYRSLIIEIENAPGIGRSDGSTTSEPYARPPASYKEYLWQLGWTDGRLGQPSEVNESVLDSQAKLDWLEEIALTERQIARAEANTTYLKGCYSRLQERLDQLQVLYNQLWTDIHQRARDHSFLLATIYLSVAALLMFADIPLSLTLVARGFDMKTEIEDPNTREIVSVKDLFTSPYLTVTHLWEPLLMAIGIALSGVFVKYFMDEILFREDSQEDDRKFYKRRGFWRTIVLSALFIGFIWTIIVLGYFRADIQRQEKLSALRTQITIDGTNRNLTQADIDQSFENAKKDLLEKDKWAEWAFISLTLLFPIVGGVCFSAGWRRLEKTSPYLGPKLKYYNTKYALWRMERRHDKVYQQFTSAEEEVKALRAKLERERTIYRKEDLLAELKKNVYRHGYERGQAVPETIDAGLSLYERCQKALHKMVAKDVRASIYQNNGKPSD